MSKTTVDHVGECVRCSAPYQTHGSPQGETGLPRGGAPLPLLPALKLVLDDPVFVPLAIEAWKSRPSIKIELSRFRKPRADGTPTEFEAYLEEQREKWETKPACSGLIEVFVVKGEGEAAHWRRERGRQKKAAAEFGALTIDARKLPEGSQVIVIPRAGKP
jgi:hypothetical protein